MLNFSKTTKTPRLAGQDPEKIRDEILAYFHNTCSLYERLFLPLMDEAYYRRADPLRHPLIFYFAHTAVFYINNLILANLLTTGSDPK